MAMFWTGRKNENCCVGDWGDWRYDVKMPNGENYVWVRKLKKAWWFFSGATGLPLCWWSQRAPYGPIIIWTQVWEWVSVKERNCMRVCRGVCGHVGPNVYKSISVDAVPNGHWLQGQASVDWLRSLWMSHNLLQRRALGAKMWRGTGGYSGHNEKSFIKI